jgi:glutathione synthase/RimK-type ligase-like ATP-grasp enzyme
LSSRGPRIAIATIQEDLHALVIREFLEHKLGVRCDILETDRIPDRGALNWSTVDGFPATIPNASGEKVAVEALNLIWWRRANHLPQIPPDISDASFVQLITNDSRAALLGVLLNEFMGTWVSDPLATRRAQNKLIQLRTAEAAGFRVPRTLVSSDPGEILRFCEMLSNRVVVKAIRGTRVRSPLTTVLDPAVLEKEESLRLCPAIYQEYVPGSNHVRAHVFGDAVHAALIRSTHVDWRVDKTYSVMATQLDKEVETRLLTVVELLGLRMGIIDLKFDDSGAVTWLEINPQGQFLFIEGLCGMPLTETFSTFLRDQAACGTGDSGPLSIGSEL